MRFAPGFVSSHNVAPYTDQLDNYIGWGQTIISTNDDGQSGTATIGTSNPYSGTGYFVFTNSPMVGGVGDVGRRSAFTIVSNPGYLSLRIAIARTADSTGVPVQMSGGTITQVSDVDTGITAPTGASPSTWHEVTYSITGGGSSLTITLNPSSTVGLNYYDKLELF